MAYLQSYRSFINSHYLSEGLRKTAGILLPTLILSHFNLLQTGMTISLGALCISISDNPGPLHHRVNGFIVCNLLIFFLAILIALIHPIPWLFIISLPIFCFVFSMIGIYGARAAAIGIAALLVIILQTLHHFQGKEILLNALFLLSGGLWYFLLSMILYSIRPFKLIQQALGDYIMATAGYLKVKASLYEKNAAILKNNEQLFSKQVAVQTKQNFVTELIFKSRSIIRESTHSGRVLVMAYLDTTDLFETTMSSHQDYQKLHGHFDETGILEEFRKLILLLAHELEEIAIAFQSGRKSIYNETIDVAVLRERDRLQELRLDSLQPSNVDVFISLKHILDTIDDIATRIRTLHQYTTYDSKFRRKKLQTPDPEDFISHEDVQFKLLLDNLSFESNIFRHSLRIALAALSAYLISHLLLSGEIGHSYWILLTIVVILKPGYSLTRKRNLERLSGTFIGAVTGALILYFVKDPAIILILLCLCMIGAYSFIRLQYMISVTMITLYVLFMFHLLDARDFKSIFYDRIIDTSIGSLLAFAFSHLLPPVWEHERIRLYIRKAIKDNLKYYDTIAHLFTGIHTERQTIRIVRKNSLVSLANLSDAFTQMLSEPKSKQKNLAEIHQMVVSNHMLTSHIATLANYGKNLDTAYITDEYLPLIILTTDFLEKALSAIDLQEPFSRSPIEINDQKRLLDKRINTLMHIRQEELRQGKIESETRKTLSQFKSITDQFYFSYKISMDIEKISKTITRSL